MPIGLYVLYCHVTRFYLLLSTFVQLLLFLVLSFLLSLIISYFSIYSSLVGSCLSLFFSFFFFSSQSVQFLTVLSPSFSHSFILPSFPPSLLPSSPYCLPLSPSPPKVVNLCNSFQTYLFPPSLPPSLLL